MDRFRLMPNYRYYSAEGASPLSITGSIGKPLRNYRIYGSGGGVGDKSKNLFDVKWIMEQTNADKFFGLNNEILILKSYACRTYISPEEFLEYTGLSEGDTIATSLNITLVAGTTTAAYFGRVTFLSKDTAAHPNLLLTVNGSSRQLTIPEGFNSTNYGDMFFYGAKNADENGNLEAHVTEFMITKDLTATEYEPYWEGYKIPVTVSNEQSIPLKTYNIYLDEPLAEGEYIDYINGSGLPRIQIGKGTNIITVDTEIKPSNIEVQYYK